jgi:hypothetical protein
MQDTLVPVFHISISNIKKYDYPDRHVYFISDITYYQFYPITVPKIMFKKLPHIGAISGVYVSLNITTYKN